MFAQRAAVLTVVAGVLLAGCVAASPGDSPDPSPLPGVSGSIAPSDGAIPATVPIDEESSIALNPVDYGGERVVVATFGEPVDGRQVDLQQHTGSGWDTVASGHQDAAGRVEFLAPYEESDHRAVALETADGTHPMVATRSAGEADQWRLDFSEGFNEESLDGEYWAPRQTGSYFGSRLCSAPYPSNLELKGGSLLVSVRESGAGRTRTVTRAAAAQLGVPESEACPFGVWDAAMVSTEGRYAFRYGTVAVRAKFPTQPGVHGSAWLQSADDKGSEIDFIETFGINYGIQHKVHYRKNGDARTEGGYVTTLPEVKSSTWWDDYHVFSVEWTSREYVFRVDGVETLRTRSGVSKAQQYIILSMLASDWELKRVVPEEMPATMAVDWIRVWQAK